jgi:hypothetical protein
MVRFKVRGNTPNRTDGLVSSSAKNGKELDRTEPYHHYAQGPRKRGHSQTALITMPHVHLGPAHHTLPSNLVALLWLVGHSV